MLSPSELILNSDGSIYHLQLRPEEIADTIITVGDPDRVGQVSCHFDEIYVKRQHREFVTHTGRIGNKPLTVISTGIGPDNIDIVLNELDALVNINFTTRTVADVHRSLQLIRVGTSGSVHPDVAMDSFLVSDYGMGIDNLMHFYDYALVAEQEALLEAFQRYLVSRDVRLPVRPYVFKASANLKAMFSEVNSGITITCPGFYAPQGRSLRAPKVISNWIEVLPAFAYEGHTITNFEMETAALYGLSSILGHEALSISAILAGRQEGQFSNHPAATVASLISFVLNKIAK